MTTSSPRSQRSSSLASHLLCAVPQLTDPNFRRAVVLMLEHGEEGALGLVLNNPLANAMTDVAASLGLVWQGSADATVRLGGPVEPVRGWILHDTPDWDPTARALAPGVWLTTSLEPATSAGRREVGADGANFVLLLGYAGWGAAQLESEIAAGSWVAVPILSGEPDDDRLGVEPTWLFHTAAEDMWDSALHAIGVDPGRLVGLKGGDLSLH